MCTRFFPVVLSHFLPGLNNGLLVLSHFYQLFFIWIWYQSADFEMNSVPCLGTTWSTRWTSLTERTLTDVGSNCTKRSAMDPDPDPVPALGTGLRYYFLVLLTQYTLVYVTLNTMFWGGGGDKKKGVIFYWKWMGYGSGFGQKPGSRVLKLKRREILKILLH